MKNVRWYWIALGLLAALAVAPASCAKNNGGGGAPPTGSPSGGPSNSPTPIPGTCGTPSANAKVVTVAMGGASLTAITSPTYGSVAGYALANTFGSGSGGKSQIIDHWYPKPSATATAAITTQNVIQFTNTDPGNNIHSAVGFSGSKFPAIPYAFPTAAASPSANTVIGNGAWSTGLLNTTDASYNPCYSQVFTVKAGVYYFGDGGHASGQPPWYNTATSFRDVLVVSGADTELKTLR